jgi:3-oxoacyl-[acyl-carrier-protein] synthase-1
VPPDAVDYVNLHGTGTRANDLAEGKAIEAVFGNRTAVSSTKGWLGHTLGACGIQEAIVSLLAIQHGLVPGSVHTERLDPELDLDYAIESRHCDVRLALSNSFGFGGSNCSLLFARA